MENGNINNVCNLLKTNPDLPEQGTAHLHCTLRFHCFFASSPFIYPENNNSTFGDSDLFFKALLEGNVEAARDQLKKNPELIQQREKEGGFTPIHCVLRSHHKHQKGIDLLELLDEYNADFNEHSAPYLKKAGPVSPLSFAISLTPLADDFFNHLIKNTNAASLGMIVFLASSTC